MANDLIDKSVRGREAKAILENELVDGALRAIEQDCVSEWARCDDAQKRDEIWHRLQASRAFLRMFKSHVANGVLADEELKRKEKSVAN